MRMRYHSKRSEFYLLGGELYDTLDRISKYNLRGFHLIEATATPGHNPPVASDLCCLYTSREMLFSFAEESNLPRAGKYLIKLGFLSHVQLQSGPAYDSQLDHDRPIVLSLHEMLDCLRLQNMLNGYIAHVTVASMGKWLWGRAYKYPRGSPAFALGQTLLVGGGTVRFHRFRARAGPFGPTAAQLMDSTRVCFVAACDTRAREGADF